MTDETTGTAGAPAGPAGGEAVAALLPTDSVPPVVPQVVPPVVPPVVPSASATQAAAEEQPAGHEPPSDPEGEA